MRNQEQIAIPLKEIAEFCQKNHILKLSLFGSVLRNDFRGDSDIDILVEFKAELGPGFLGFARMERELSNLLGGRKVDLRTPNELSRYFRDDVLTTAKVQYAEG